MTNHQRSHQIHHIKLVYVDGFQVLNQLTILGRSENSFDFSYYQHLGMPLGYQLDYSEGHLPLDFVKDGRIKFHVIKKGIGSKRFKDVKVRHVKRNDETHVKHRHHVHRRMYRHNRSKYKQILSHNDPYDDINIALLTLGYSIKKIGQIIQRLHRE